MTPAFNVLFVCTHNSARSIFDRVPAGLGIRRRPRAANCDGAVRRIQVGLSDRSLYPGLRGDQFRSGAAIAGLYQSRHLAGIRQA